MAWLGKTAVLWVMDDAPGVPPHLLAALLAVARFADDQGCGSYPSAATVAAIIRKTERNAKKDLAALREMGLLLEGDQRLVRDIRADKRPFVYDLPMSRGVAQDTPSGHNGVSQATARGVAERSSGVSQTTPKEICKRSRKARGDGANSPRPPRAHQTCPRCGKPPDEHGRCSGCHRSHRTCECAGNTP